MTCHNSGTVMYWQVTVCVLSLNPGIGSCLVHRSQQAHRAEIHFLTFNAGLYRKGC